MEMILFTADTAQWPFAPGLRPDEVSRYSRVVLRTESPVSEILSHVHGLLQAAPFGWVVARGPAVAIVQHVIAKHLGLRLSGAVFFAPRVWVGAGGQVALGLDPLPCPSVVVGDCDPPQATAEHVLAWGSSWVPRLLRGDLHATPAFRDMVALRHAALRGADPA